MTRQGFTLLLDSVLSVDTITQTTTVEYAYEGDYYHEGHDFHYTELYFFGDTLTAVKMCDTCTINCQKQMETLQTNLEREYGHLETADSTFLFFLVNMVDTIDESNPWSRYDGHNIISISSSDTTIVCSYISNDVLQNYINKRMRLALYILNDILHSDNPNYSEENKVYGVAGVKFGDSRETVRKVIGAKSEELSDYDSHSLTYYKTQIGGTTYDFATFYFKQGKLVSASLEKPFYSWRKEEALMYLEAIKSQYERRYSNFRVVTDEEEKKFYTCGAYIDEYDYLPISISFKKSVSKGGDIMYYIDIDYYLVRVEGLYDDEI
ncbi:MAG TPA: hypothetical protein DIW30_04120 [Bacteroidales bacterium]|nr:hypothetical protein [Bacteroidales bacterium]